MHYALSGPAPDIWFELWHGLNRLAAYAMLNLVDDPALLAMVFC